MFRSVRRRMIAFIAVPTMAIYVAVLGLTMARLWESAGREVRRDMTRLAANYAARFDAAFREAATIATSSARFMERAPDLPEPEIFALLRSNLLQNPAVYGAAMAFEPGSYRPGDELFSPYVYRGPDGLVEMNISREVYDWYGDPRWQWYQLPKRLGRGTWTDPYFDEGAGNMLMVTWSAPFFRDGRLRGVTTVDVVIPTLQESIGREIAADLDFVIVTSDGHYVSSPDPEAVMGPTVFEQAESAGRGDLVAVARRIVSGEPGMAVVEGWDAPLRQWVFFAPIPSTGWAFVSRVPQRVALASVRTRMTFATLAAAAAIAAIVACIWYVSGRITRPIETLRAKVIEISGGNLEARVEGITGDDEIGQLARSFNAMTADLGVHVERLAQERGARERLERDLDLAREIQRGLLPRSPPVVPGFEIAGWNQAADRTGGDYFDWLQLPDGRTMVALADVAGHGIGPALIAAVSRAYMRASTAGGDVDLFQALSRVNDLLRADMPEGRFVTAALGVVDPAHHRMWLLSAGQAPILFYEAASSTVHSWGADELPLGLVRGMSGESPREIAFAPGDVLVLATDGFFEWFDESGERFGTGRMMEFIRANHRLRGTEFIEALHRTVLAHGAGIGQADDLTAVVIRRV